MFAALSPIPVAISGCAVPMWLSLETLGSASVQISQLSLGRCYPIDGQKGKGVTEKSTMAEWLREFVNARMGHAPKEPLWPLFWSDPPPWSTPHLMIECRWAKQNFTWLNNIQYVKQFSPKEMLDKKIAHKQLCIISHGLQYGYNKMILY